MPKIEKIEMQGFKSFAKRTIVSFPSNFSVICGPNGSGKCLVGNSKVMLDNGELLEIKELVDRSLENSNKIEKLKDGYLTKENPCNFKILTLNPRTMKFDTKPVFAFIKRKSPKKLFKIKTRYGKEITVTATHPFFTIKNGVFCSTPANKLKEGSIIAVPRILNLNKEESELKPSTIDFSNRQQFTKPYYWSAYLARFLGYMLSEGRTSDTSNQLWFVNSDPALIKDFSTVTFGIPTNEYHYKPPNVDSIIYSKALQLWIEKTFDFKIGSASKEIPSKILSAPDSVALNFMAGLFDCDGYIHFDGRQAYFEYSTASKELAYGVSTLLLRFGFISSIKKKFKCSTNTKNKIKKPYYSVYLYGHSELKRLTQLIPFRSKDKQVIIERIQHAEIKGNPNTDLIPNINGLIKIAVKYSKTNVKRLKKQCPKLQAYYENRCLPSREGLKEVIGFIRKYGKVDEGINSLLHYLFNLADSEIFWDEISKIKEIKSKEKYVYDLSIKDTHNFVAENFIVHNSNILDSIIFVLGRTSAKSLRADRMFEMIYHGSKTKPAADFAKVTLFFDNSDRAFPVEDDKVVISRKINRNGISIYKLNGKTVTRETVQEILRAGHIQPDGHNIILQGNVTEIIEMSPLKRREIIDEISGIKEFDEKREKAKRELMTVEERLRESNIVLNEKYSLMQRLENDMKSAQKYEKLTSELDKLRASLAKLKLQEAETTMKKIDDKIMSLSLEELDKQYKEVEKELENIEKKREEISKRLFDRAKDIEIIKEVERLRSEINRKKDKIGLNRSEIDRIENLIKRFEIFRQKELEGSFSKAVQEILKLKKTGVYGTISSLSKVKPEFQTAIEVCAGNHLQDIVVSDENIAIECVNYLKKNKIGRATFLPLDKIKIRSSKDIEKFLGKPGVIDIAINLVEFDKKYYNAFSYVFGDTLIIDKIETAKKIGFGEARFVTLDGDLIEKTGAVIGGYYLGKKVFTEMEEINKYIEHKNKLESEISQLEKEISTHTKQLEQLTAEERLGSKELTKLQKEREELDNRYENLKNKRRKIYEDKINSQEEINKWKIRKARLEAELDNLKLEFEHYKDKETIKIPVETIESRIKEITAQINALGPINMKALEEYKHEKIVYDELKEKVEKLTEERNKILEIMAEIEGKRKDTFLKTLNGIREQFKIVYKDMTNGDADLRLEGDMDSGLIIEANPSGRKLLNIDLMSGGEKSITALAFLFAIQRFRPSPFYILDEVDAALDKLNTKKSIDLIKKYSTTSQFIVISHNDATVQAADCVYGVSMEDGESKIVGIKMPS